MKAHCKKGRSQKQVSMSKEDTVRKRKEPITDNSNCNDYISSFNVLYSEVDCLVYDVRTHGAIAPGAFRGARARDGQGDDSLRDTREKAPSSVSSS